MTDKRKQYIKNAASMAELKQEEDKEFIEKLKKEILKKDAERYAQGWVPSRIDVEFE